MFIDSRYHAYAPLLHSHLQLAHLHTNDALRQSAPSDNVMNGDVQIYWKFHFWLIFVQRCCAECSWMYRSQNAYLFIAWIVIDKTFAFNGRACSILVYTVQIFRFYFLFFFLMNKKPLLIGIPTFSIELGGLVW